MKLPSHSLRRRSGVSTTLCCLLLFTFMGQPSVHGLPPGVPPIPSITDPVTHGYLDLRRIARSSQLPNASFFTQAEISRQAEMTEGAVLYIYDKERQLVGAKRLSDGSVEAYSQTDDSLFLSTRVLQYQGTERGPRAKIIGSYTELQKVSDDGQLLWNLSNPDGENDFLVSFIRFKDLF